MAGYNSPSQFIMICLSSRLHEVVKKPTKDNCYAMQTHIKPLCKAIPSRGKNIDVALRPAFIKKWTTSPSFLFSSILPRPAKTTKKRENVNHQPEFFIPNASETKVDAFHTSTILFESSKSVQAAKICSKALQADDFLLFPSPRGTASEEIRKKSNLSDCWGYKDETNTDELRKTSAVRRTIWIVDFARYRATSLFSNSNVATVAMHVACRRHAGSVQDLHARESKL